MVLSAAIQWVFNNIIQPMSTHSIIQLTDLYYVVINYNYVIHNKQCKNITGRSLLVLLSTRYKQYTKSLTCSA